LAENFKTVAKLWLKNANNVQAADFGLIALRLLLSPLLRIFFFCR
jgi:hypothetical protein